MSYAPFITVIHNENRVYKEAPQDMCTFERRIFPRSLNKFSTDSPIGMFLPFLSATILNKSRSDI